MKYDPTTKLLTLPDGRELHSEVVQAVCGDVLDGRAVLVQQHEEDEGLFWYVARTGAEPDGRAVISKRRVKHERLVKRLLRMFGDWSRRQAPETREPGCTWPACACRPHTSGRVLCDPLIDVAAQLGLASAEVIEPKCPTCSSALLVGEERQQQGAAVRDARCSEPDRDRCSWRGVIVVYVRTVEAEDA